MKYNKTIGVRVDKKNYDVIKLICKNYNMNTSELIKKGITLVFLLPELISSETWEMLIAIEKYNGQTKIEMAKRMFDINVKQLYDRLPKDKNKEIKHEI